MADDWQAHADPTGSGDRGGQRLSLAGEAEDEFDGVQDAVVQVGVRTVFQRVELGVGDLGVITFNAHVLRARARRTVGDAVARASRSRSSGSESNSCWASVTTRAGCRSKLPSGVFAHHKALIGTAGQHCTAAVIGFYNGRLSHHTSIAHIPIMGTRRLVPVSAGRIGRFQLGARDPSGPSCGPR